ncbi:hypothetical protein O0L34_g5819 [Tuta absoluta]|nr:hypothetical protein O0L34_g10066 [Tuta absoluta]KAJ2948889.1 hypothetical protein O0L34_g5819 [Tuta absoluta]
MSPETTKIVNILADEIFDPELNVSSDEDGKQIKIHKTLLVSAKTTLNLEKAVEEPEQDNKEAGPLSSSLTHSSSPHIKNSPHSCNNKLKEHALNEHDIHVQADNGFSDCSENSKSLITVHADIHIATNASNMKYTTTESNKTLMTNDFGDGVVNNNALLITTNNIDSTILSVENPGEKRIDAHPSSPVSSRQIQSIVEISNYDADNDTDYDEENEIRSFEAPPFHSNNQAFDYLAEEPGETSIEAPPFSPLTPRPRTAARQRMQMSSTRPAKSQMAAKLPHKSKLNKKGNNSYYQGVDYLASAEEPGDTSIETPPFSPLTPRPRRSTAKQKEHRSSLAKSPTLSDIAASYSDDSVKDPDYECEEDKNNNSDISISLIRMQMHDLENDTADFELESPFNQEGNPSDNDSEIAVRPRIHDMDNEVTDIELDPSVNEDKNPSDNDSEISVSLIRPQMPDLDNDATDIDLDINTEVTAQPEVLPIRTENTGRPKRGRKRKYGEMSREERKRRKYSNLSYVNSKKKQVDPKMFIDYRCGCLKNCHELVSAEIRLKEFNKFYALGTYNSQNMYLAACVKEQPVKRSYVSTNKTNICKQKTYSRQYFLQNTAVCREMFVKTLQTTPKRINTSLSKKRSDDHITDRRGAQAGHNKVPPEQVGFFINIVKKLPTYTSHYRRNEVNDAKFLKPDMTFPKIYDLYCKEAALVQMPTISFEKAKQIFVTRFNLRTKPLKKDTCNKCDSFESQKTNASEEDKVKIDKAHTAHLKFAKDLQSQLKTDMVFAKTDEFTETLTFDLEKTLPLPRISTNIVFYKRQLWVYNLGIHSGSDDQAHCNVWVEGEAGRGAQEVGSCLIKHLLEGLKPNVKHVIFWSDSCGGQNRNIKLTLMLKALLHSHPTLEKISLRFLESGHSFLPNDTDFGRIECALKLQQRLYTPEDYMEVMKHCKQKKPMRVHRMQKNDFVSSSKLESLVTNRKKAVDGSKISWLKTKEIVLKKEDMFSIFMRPDLDEKTEYTVVNIKKNTRGRQIVLRKELMDPLWPTGKPIPTPKLQDLKSLMHLIPRDDQGFYKNLTSDDSVEDDVDGFSGGIDFEFDENDGYTQINE